MHRSLKGGDQCQENGEVGWAEGEKRDFFPVAGSQHVPETGAFTSCSIFMQASVIENAISNLPLVFILSMTMQSTGIVSTLNGAHCSVLNIAKCIEKTAGQINT